MSALAVESIFGAGTVRRNPTGNESIDALDQVAGRNGAKWR
jgi:hypothetical protein